MTIRTAPIPSGAKGLALPTAAPTVNTRKNVPIASTAYFTPARGPTGSGACSRMNAWVGAGDATMALRIAVAMADVVSTEAQHSCLPDVLAAYLPAVINSPIRPIVRGRHRSARSYPFMENY